MFAKGWLQRGYAETSSTIRSRGQRTRTPRRHPSSPDPGKGQEVALPTTGGTVTARRAALEAGGGSDVPATHVAVGWTPGLPCPSNSPAPPGGRSFTVATYNATVEQHDAMIEIATVKSPALSASHYCVPSEAALIASPGCSRS